MSNESSELESSDSKQIGTSAMAKQLMDDPIFKRHFIHQQHMIKFAVAVAIVKKLAPNRDGLRGPTTHRVTDLDEDGSLRFIVQQYKGETQKPYFVAEGLAEAGFIYIAEQLRRGRNLQDLIEDEEEN